MPFSSVDGCFSLLHHLDMIGREKEIKELNRLYTSNRAELVAVYGRIRVGKTYLIDNVFKGKITFMHAGLSPLEKRKSTTLLKDQLHHFYESLLLYGAEVESCPENWLDAFFLLEKFLMSCDSGERQVVFFDELPWMDTPKSGFITAFEGFWNNWACHRSNLMVIVCGSATSWITNNLINNHGGLYGRVTKEIKLSPFTLAECEEFFKSQNVLLSRYDIVQSYMIVGGIPFYLSCFTPGLSLSQNIDEIFFNRTAPLRNEFDRLFSSVFTNPDAMKSIVKVLSTKNIGFTREELAEKLKIASGGTFTKNLNALIESDFVTKYIPYAAKKKDALYKLVDPFCLFYIKFIDNKNAFSEHFWTERTVSQPIAVWRGFAFENVCFNHISQIKAALGITGVRTEQYAWSKKTDDDEGTQIDLLIVRSDNVVNMCELKFYGNDFSVSKNYDKRLRTRQSILADEIPKKTVIHSTLITTFGLTYNEYSSDFVNVITMDDLFRFE